MKWASALAVSLVSALVTAQSPVLKAPLSSEQELLAALDSGEAFDVDTSLVSSCISRSWWTAARRLIANSHKDAQARDAAASNSVPQMHDQVSRLLREIKANADELATFADAGQAGKSKGLDEVPCALQWAQNSSAVFLGVKYAQRWSAPGAIEVGNLQVSSSPCCFNLSGLGHHSSIRKHYVVELEFFGKIVESTSSWSSASVGRLTATFHKAKPGVRWPRLTKTSDKSRHQLTTWMDMQDRWEKELESVERSEAEKAKAAKTGKAEPSKAKKTWRQWLSKTWRRLKRAVASRRRTLLIIAAASTVVAVIISVCYWICR